jgi:hypothetical protein
MEQLLAKPPRTENVIGLPLPPEVLILIVCPTRPSKIGLVMSNGAVGSLKVKDTGAEVTGLRAELLGFKIANTLQVAAALEVK